MTNTITLTDVSRAGSQQQMLIVSRNGREIGFITKFHKSRGENQPYKAWRGIPGHMVAVYYGKGAKRKAVDAVTATVFVPEAQRL
jgi:hypothetical protein